MVHADRRAGGEIEKQNSATARRKEFQMTEKQDLERRASRLREFITEAEEALEGTMLSADARAETLEWSTIDQEELTNIERRLKEME